MRPLSRVQLFVTPWTVTYQALLSIGFSRQEYWIGLPFPSPGDLPDPGIEPRSPAVEADALPSEPPGFRCRVGLFIQLFSCLAALKSRIYILYGKAIVGFAGSLDCKASAYNAGDPGSIPG